MNPETVTLMRGRPSEPDRSRAGEPPVPERSGLSNER